MCEKRNVASSHWIRLARNGSSSARPVRKPSSHQGTTLPDELRNLQRLAGNAAVADLLSDAAAVVQRDDLAVADAELKAVEERSQQAAKQGRFLSEKERHEMATKELAAEQHAQEASQAALAGTKGVAGGEVGATLGRVADSITRIEGARARGYLQAVNDLNAKGLDKEADYQQFSIALAGNLLWALSGLIPLPETIAASIAMKALAKFFETQAATVWTTAFGVVGAMGAQFSGGLPSGSSVSDIKIAMETLLTEINSAVCNEQRRQAYRLMVEALEAAPPEPGVRAADYMAEMEYGLRNTLFGDIYKRGLNSGVEVDAAKVQQDARDQLLHQYLAGSTAVWKGKVVVSAPAEAHNMVKEATELLGPAKVKFSPYELVVNQVKNAAADMGCEVDVDEDQIAAKLKAGGMVQIPVKSWRSYQLFGPGMPTHWLNPLFTDHIVECHPWPSNAAYMNSANVGTITDLTFTPGVLSSMKQDGQIIYSLNEISFWTKGGRDTRGFISVTDVADQMRIDYRITEFPDRAGYHGTRVD